MLAPRRFEHIDTVRALVDAGADPYVQNRYTQTPVLLARINQRPDIVPTAAAAGWGPRKHPELLHATFSKTSVRMIPKPARVLHVCTHCIYTLWNSRSTRSAGGDCG